MLVRKIDIALPPSQTGYLYFGLLWGSVDNYNTLSFYNGSTLIGTITGADITPTATGDQGVNGTFYVNLVSTTPFDRVVATSSQYAFSSTTSRSARRTRCRNPPRCCSSAAASSVSPPRCAAVVASRGTSILRV